MSALNCKKCGQELAYHDATVRWMPDGWEIIEVTVEQGFCEACDDWKEAVYEEE